MARLVIFWFSIALLLTSVSAVTRIMPLGDSITGSPGCWRALLWQKLQGNGIAKEVKFVGTLPAPGCGFQYDGANEGHGGFLAIDIVNQNRLSGWLEETHPDIIIMHLGTNDVWSNKSPTQIIGAFSKLLDQMRANKPSMKLLVAKIIPLNPKNCGECGQRVVELNKAIENWAVSKSIAVSPVTVVDCHSGFNPTMDTNDGVHPNDSGNKKLANCWYEPLLAAIAGK